MEKISTYTPPFHKVGYHDNDVDTLLPHHAPEGIEGGGQWALGANVGPWFVIAINVISIHILHGLLLSRERA